MSMLRSYSLLALIFGLFATPAFSVEEVKAGITTLNDAPMTKAAARRMLKTEKSGEDVSANITWPADGSTIKAMTKSKIKYQVRGANAYHARLYIDGKESDSLLKPHGIMDSLLKPKGSLRIAKLPVGEHELCIKTLNKSHKEIGKAGCIKVIAQ